MRTPARLMWRMGIALAAIAVVAAIPATASMAASGHVGRASSAATQATAADHQGPRISNGAADNCYSGFYCNFKQTDGNGFCFDSDEAISNWNAAGCRNIDESFSNRLGELVRLYYSPNYQGAWACVDNGWYSNNMNKDVYTFDNGSGDAGYGQEIWDNVASSKPAGGSCSNPLPEDG